MTEQHDPDNAKEKTEEKAPRVEIHGGSGDIVIVDGDAQFTIINRW